jgi:hypothetical protein
MSLIFCRNNLLAAIQILMICIFASPLYGQRMTGKQKETENIFIARIKQFNEFADRFNLVTDFNGNPVDSVFRAKMPRDKMIPLLFDLKDPRTLAKNADYSEDFIRTKTDFIKEVIKKDLILDKYSPGIIAEARSRILINGNPQTVRIFLNQEIVGKGRVKWVILFVTGNFSDIFKTDTSMIRFIPPTSNETDFINLKRALEDIDHLHYYAYDGFEPDYLTLFFYYLNSGIIRYEYAEEVVYHIISIPGWYIKVRDFNRNELNSGWLITDIARNSFGITDFIKKLN